MYTLQMVSEAGQLIGSRLSKVRKQNGDTLRFNSKTYLIKEVHYDGRMAIVEVEEICKMEKIAVA